MPSGIYKHKKGYKRPPFSEEWKRKIGEASKNRIVSKETREKLGQKLRTGKVINCIFCGKEKYYPLSDIKAGAKFCSNQCKGKINGKINGKKGLGKKMSEEHKRKISEAHKGKRHNGYLKGFKHHWWKGGKTSISKLIREISEYNFWRKSVFERDNYTCVLCGKKGNRLEANHKKAFNKILQEFLQTYSQFSPLEDKETLVRLATTYEPFWELSNGETMCEICHGRTNTYGRPINMLKKEDGE